MMEDLTKNIIFTTNAIGANGQPTTIQYQSAADGTLLKQPKIEGQKEQHQQPTFYYTTNANGQTVNLAQLAAAGTAVATSAGEEQKTCYIQPVPGYNYALVNGVQLNQGGSIGIATLDAQGRLQIVNQNKPLTTTIPSLRSLLNSQKQSADQQQTETLVNAQGLVQTQNIITENGQMGQIQIVSADTLEPAVLQQHQQQQQQQQNDTSSSGSSGNKSQSKCITCGAHVLQPVKQRKGSKMLRCESCVHNDQTAQQHIVTAASTAPSAQQIFMAPDGEIKFEMQELRSGTSESSMDSLTAQNLNQIQPVQLISTTPQAQAQLQQLVAQHTSITTTPSGGVVTKRENCTPGHHPVKKRNSQQIAKCQKCNGSGVVFVGSGQAANAKGIKTENPKPFTCNICGGTFSRYSSLWSHKKLHSGEKNYKCPICGLAFAKAVYLKNHARIHTGEKPYKCQTCGMQFSQSPHLKNHERTHSGERPYVCEVCDKGFARHATLWNHRRIHTGEKPYKCEICGSAFSQAAHLKNHAKVHSGEKPFKCDICSAAFADRFALKRHRGIHQKYGQTAPRQPAQTSNQNQINTDGVIIQKREVEDEAHEEMVISGL